MEEFKRKIDKYTFGGISGILILSAIIIADELGAVQYGGDTGALLWTTFHFVINPLFCVIYIILTVLKGIHTKEKIRLFYPLGIAVALFYLYISISGNIFWLELFGIDFNPK